MEKFLNIASQAQQADAGLETATTFSWWLLIVLFQFIIITFLLYKNRKLRLAQVNSDEFGELKSAKTSEINMTDLMNDINNSRDEYKILSRKCHPDRFQDEEEKRKADEIFQEISMHKRNHAKLSELKIRAEKELNITF
ncbi:hypothetical protein ACKGJN_11310 [Gillisia sp. Q332]|uniref:hypothetical protein n=1 Tax=Gillisia xinjiangensis TaxID=3384765 RepID=UPI00391B69E5